ncbi:ADP-ribosylation factor GTPase-activating protein AGD2-like [Hibiscus syriacus]|uniref:ADP-ribosylation factor GTPase-activating protein AGD2-like n=1 Tax=Hibiscus syriacus TaxID=106335 RepID=UPI00192405DA|nr:ADP-ribosylation factor GTPase-activating protein AGD2-like [Hibiscus syriacus]
MGIEGKLILESDCSKALDWIRNPDSCSLLNSIVKEIVSIGIDRNVIVFLGESFLVKIIFDSLDSHKEERERHDPSACQRIKDLNDPGNCLQGCSLLHLACQGGSIVMLELLLQFGADKNIPDFHGRTPLHHCIALGNNSLAKHLLRRGARSSIKDHRGFSALERAMEKGAITNEELFLLLNES